ncbi:DNA polymerase-3 subunit delta' [Amphibacillus marinus]|uniref:DNA polymerase-3 subunit delta n=1 Tax=Amphibacillus marinus TaxID=872970 RepID=A0A1H8PAK9_9BACI|nr:DNA polymerase III subunit delta' [Amphibacillus marinus]SEO38962.1 DNA polymerase-3 subunit delta' [Amphibacillus marinus]
MKTWDALSEIQPIAVNMLKQMIIKQRVAHAYLIYGDKGTGKAMLGLMLAKSLFCQNKHGGEPCLACVNCRRIDSGNHPDLHWIRPDGASIKKEQIAHLQKEFTYTGLESNQKVYLITQADLMTTNAANRLLKFLEEPSQQTTAILLTENYQSILDTIKSRCQIISLKPLVTQRVQTRLESEGISKENARLFASVSQNLDQARALNQDEWFAQARKLVVQLVGILQANHGEALLFIQKQWLQHFSDREQQNFGLDLILYWFKDLIYLDIDQKDSLVFIAYYEELEKCLWHWSRADATKVIYAIMDAKRNLNYNVHPTLVMEQLTLQMQR